MPQPERGYVSQEITSRYTLDGVAAYAVMDHKVSEKLKKGACGIELGAKRRSRLGLSPDTPRPRQM